MKEKDVQKLIDAAIKKERGRLARHIRDFVKERHEDLAGKGLNAWSEKTFSYWDMVMLAKDLQWARPIRKVES